MTIRLEDLDEVVSTVGELDGEEKIMLSAGRVSGGCARCFRTACFLSYEGVGDSPSPFIALELIH